MTEDNAKYIESILHYIKGELFRITPEEESILYVDWIKFLITDTIKHEKELNINSQIRFEKKKNNPDENKIKQLKKKKKKYEHTNYNHKLKIGDIVYVNYGYGYCGELSTGHYGIIMSEIINNMYFVVPLSSDPLNDFIFYFEGLNLPNSEANNDKKSYVRFEQARFMHYRRITNITINNRAIYRTLTSEQIKLLKEKYIDFMNLGIDMTQEQ